MNGNKAASADHLLTTSAALLALADRVDAATVADNALDVEIEVSAFTPMPPYVAIRANAAGTKVIYTRLGGAEQTHRALDWTQTRAQREHTAASLRARAAMLADGGEG